MDVYAPSSCEVVILGTRNKNRGNALNWKRKESYRT